MRDRFRRFSGLAAIAALSCAFQGSAPAQTVSEFEGELRGVPYLTLRNRTGETVPDAFYGDDRSSLKAGRCSIREVDLGALAPVADAASPYLRDELLRLSRIEEMDPARFFQELESDVANRQPLIYTHGFYVNFEKGCRRATLFQENACLEGRFLWFSWPSDGALTNYTRDEADLYWSVPDLADAIAGMAGRFGNGEVHVAGHSLGARGMILALYELASRDPDLRLGELVLLAPDIDFGIFQRLLPRIRPIVRGITVYVSSADRPLALSAQVHGYPRLGEAGNNVTVLQGVEVIDLSGIPARSPTGHLYHIFNPEVGADVNQLLNDGKRAPQRRNLVQAGDNLWNLLPANSAD
jgi:esterase/lipase superfamily enzyme